MAEVMEEKRTLFRITAERAQIIEEIYRAETPEKLKELMLKDAGNHDEFKSKVQEYYDARLNKIAEMRRLQADAKIYREEAEKIEKRALDAAGDVDRIEAALKMVMETLSMTRVETPRSNLVELQEGKGRPAVEITGEIPARFKRRKLSFSLPVPQVSTGVEARLTWLKKRYDVDDKTEVDKKALGDAIAANDKEVMAVAHFAQREKKIVFK